ncbi:HAD family hydrolase [Streptomyces sp. NPDC088725]|uniref:HAD family hydrolase n=1 Tax=Streptomyces sp. NPDC088725 TaxID=3365873 RepID=UPI003804FC63
MLTHRAPPHPPTAVRIGDTAADIEGARENGVRVIAVATGRSSVTEPRAAGAEFVLDDLTDTARPVELVTSRQADPRTRTKVARRGIHPRRPPGTRSGCGNGAFPPVTHCS